MPHGPVSKAPAQRRVLAFDEPARQACLRGQQIETVERAGLNLHRAGRATLFEPAGILEALGPRELRFLLPKRGCPKSDSNRHWTNFKSVAPGACIPKLG